MYSVFIFKLHNLIAYKISKSTNINLKSSNVIRTLLCKKRKIKLIKQQ